MTNFSSSADRTPEPDQKGVRRPLSEDQKRAKNIRDRERRLQHKREFERLQNVELEFKKLQDQAQMRTNIITKSREEMLISSQGNQFQSQPQALLGGEINEMLSNPAVVRPRPPMPESIGAAVVQAQVIAALAAEESTVIDKEIVTNRFTMREPFVFVASKTQEVTSILLRGKCLGIPEAGLLQYSFEWIPHQTNEEPLENLGWSDVGLLQYLAQPNFPIKFLLWNSVGALTANRQRVVMDLINRVQPAVLVLTETRLSRARAEQITGMFPFDAHRFTPNFEFVGGMWLLWRSGMVDVEVLSFTEQEIHALIKEPQTNQNLFPLGFFTDVNFDSLEQSPPIHVPCPNEQVQGNTPSQTASMQYADEVVEKFTNKLDAMEKNDVELSHFKGLKEELEAIGTNTLLPPSLGPIDKRIKRVYGDITSGSLSSACIIRDCYILLCSVIKEMDELKLEQVDENKMLFWRDAINSGLLNGLRGGFAIDHLKKIAHAFYGLKAWNEGCNDKKDKESIERRMSELKIELRSLEEEHARKTEEQNSEVRNQCINLAGEFWGKPLSTNLFPPFDPPACN